MAAVTHHPRLHIRRTSPGFASRRELSLAVGPPPLQNLDMDDSDSDDEPPPAIKFSKVTQALLADTPGLLSSPKRDSSAPVALSSGVNRTTIDTPSRAPSLQIIRKRSPDLSRSVRGASPSSTAQAQPGSAVKRSVSVSGLYQSRYASRREPTPDRGLVQDVVTPAQALRQVKIVTRSRANSASSQDGRSVYVSSATRSRSRSRPASAVQSDHDQDAVYDALQGISQELQQETAAKFSSSTAGRTRNTVEVPPPGSQRVKRAPLTGSFLRSGPVRRGFRRRESEENVSPVDDAASGSASNYTPRDRSVGPGERPGSRSGFSNARLGSVEPISTHDFAPQEDNSRRSSSRPSSNHGGAVATRSRTGSRSRGTPSSMQDNGIREPHPNTEPLSAPTNSNEPGSTSNHRNGLQRQPNVDIVHNKPSAERNIPARALSTKSSQVRYAGKFHGEQSSDKENLPPPTFKRNKDQDFKYIGQVAGEDVRVQRRQVEETPVPTHGAPEPRRALGAISGNTPHRSAPAPPPKMSVLDAATTSAGAAVVKSKKKRSHIVVNGKIFTQMGKIGKGGSSDVYCVMAENYKMFALKRVKLDDCDESAVRGFKGEIDLLKKLTEVERVVRLFDWELNEERQELCVLMEKGDTDLNRLLTLRFNGEGSEFDAAFTRYHWREMLECVQAVHGQDIVHSDLKPANFLLVQGRLKLIDFGIANAIDTDNTCNVHRDTHVGTPNYMSPESITDTNASQGGRDQAGRPLKKDMKIGKASDVWSLGCILYQMAYGRPPFAHIPNHITRIMAITNPNHTIEFPPVGVGKAPIPASLRGLLRRCLDRDPDKRPTCQQMLDRKDVFLNPEADGAVMMTEELLGQIISKVVSRCCDPIRGAPTAEEVRQYPRGFMEKIRDMVDRG